MNRNTMPVSSEISDFTPCAHAQSNIQHIKYAQKIDDKGLVFMLRLEKEK